MKIKVFRRDNGEDKLIFGEAFACILSPAGFCCVFEDGIVTMGERVDAYAIQYDLRDRQFRKKKMYIDEGDTLKIPYSGEYEVLSGSTWEHDYISFTNHLAELLEEQGGKIEARLDEEKRLLLNWYEGTWTHYASWCDESLYRDYDTGPARTYIERDGHIIPGEIGFCFYKQPDNEEINLVFFSVLMNGEFILHKPEGEQVLSLNEISHLIDEGIIFPQLYEGDYRVRIPDVGLLNLRGTRLYCRRETDKEWWKLLLSEISRRPAEPEQAEEYLVNYNFGPYYRRTPWYGRLPGLKEYVTTKRKLSTHEIRQKRKKFYTEELKKINSVLKDVEDLGEKPYKREVVMSIFNQYESPLSDLFNASRGSYLNFCIEELFYQTFCNKELLYSVAETAEKIILKGDGLTNESVFRVENFQTQDKKKHISNMLFFLDDNPHVGPVFADKSVISEPEELLLWLLYGIHYGASASEIIDFLKKQNKILKLEPAVAMTIFWAMQRDEYVLNLQDGQQRHIAKLLLQAVEAAPYSTWLIQLALPNILTMAELAGDLQEDQQEELYLLIRKTVCYILDDPLGGHGSLLIDALWKREQKLVLAAVKVLCWLSWHLSYRITNALKDYRSSIEMGKWFIRRNNSKCDFTILKDLIKLKIFMDRFEDFLSKKANYKIKSYLNQIKEDIAILLEEPVRDYIECSYTAFIDNWSNSGVTSEQKKDVDMLEAFFYTMQYVVPYRKRYWDDLSLYWDVPLKALAIEEDERIFPILFLWTIPNCRHNIRYCFWKHLMELTLVFCEDDMFRERWLNKILWVLHEKGGSVLRYCVPLIRLGAMDKYANADAAILLGDILQECYAKHISLEEWTTIEEWHELSDTIKHVMKTEEWLLLQDYWNECLVAIDFNLEYDIRKRPRYLEFRNLFTEE